MNEDREKKESLDELMDVMFRHHRLSSAGARQILEEAQKNQREVAATMKQSEDAAAQLNRILSEQTAAVQAQAKDLGFTDEDLRQLQQQVSRDFGIEVDVEHEYRKQSSQDLQTVLEGMRKAVESCGETVWGQSAFLQDLARAFFRPWVHGKNDDQLRNVFVISGPAGSGRHLGLRVMVELLASEHWLADQTITVLQGSRYAGSEQETNFIQDLYSASRSRAQVILLEQAEAMAPTLFNQLVQLCQQGQIALNKRYVEQQGRLMEAGSSLVSQAVASLNIGGRYLVFMTEDNRALMRQFPLSLAQRILDQPRTQPLSTPVLERIYAAQIAQCVQRAKRQLNVELIVSPAQQQQRLAAMDIDAGARTLIRDVQQLFSALSELCLKQTRPCRQVEARCGQPWDLVTDEKIVPLNELIRIEKEDLAQIRQEMAQIVGLQEVKEIVLSMEEHAKVAQMRHKQGLKNAPVSRHMIFTGNPGTGKTTMARLIARLFKALGLLSQGQLVEVSRSDLVGRYVGHTAPLTRQVIESALGGILFIDEAYSLVRGKDDSFGLEAVDTLVKGMEDYRDDLIVILAGYSREMSEFLEANSGLQSRFPNILHFADYTGGELTQIAQSIARGKEYVIEESCLNDLTIYFNTVQMNDSQRSGNGRLARNVVEKAILNQSGRILKHPQARLDLLIREDFDLELPAGTTAM